MAFNYKYGGKEIPSPGWDKYYQKEIDIAKIHKEWEAMRPKVEQKSNTMAIPENIFTDAFFKTLSQALTKQGVDVDIAPAINADGRKGVIITILEPIKNDKEGEKK